LDHILVICICVAEEYDVTHEGFEKLIYGKVYILLTL
jgi:hypothetical protein